MWTILSHLRILYVYQVLYNTVVMAFRWWFLHWWVFYRCLSTFLNHVKIHPLELTKHHHHPQNGQKCKWPPVKLHLCLMTHRQLPLFLTVENKGIGSRFLGFNNTTRYLIELIDTFFQFKTCHVITVFLDFYTSQFRLGFQTKSYEFSRYKSQWEIFW